MQVPAMAMGSPRSIIPYHLPSLTILDLSSRLRLRGCNNRILQLDAALGNSHLSQNAVCEAGLCGGVGSIREVWWGSYLIPIIDYNSHCTKLARIFSFIILNLERTFPSVIWAISIWNGIWTFFLCKINRCSDNVPPFIHALVK